MSALTRLPRRQSITQRTLRSDTREFGVHTPNPRVCSLPGRPGSSSRSRRRVLHESYAIAVWADLSVARVQLAAVHRIVIVWLILIGDEVDAHFAVLFTIRMILKLQGRPNRRVLRSKGSLGQSGKWYYGKRRHSDLKHLPTRMFRLIFHLNHPPFDRNALIPEIHGPDHGPHHIIRAITRSCQCCCHVLMHRPIQRSEG